jgi:hypothetical protein
MPLRFVSAMAGALVALAIAVPSSAQGKSGGKNPAKGPTRPPSTGGVSAPATTPSAPAVSASADSELVVDVPLATASPFAWLDDASLIEPGTVWIGLSMIRWQGSGFGQTIGPVVDAALGLSPRVQLAASVPRVAGGLGPTFFGAKIAVYEHDARAFKVAIAPTLEIVDGASMLDAPGEGRTRWGLPVSAQIDLGGSRIYASSGYFSPGIWYAGAGVARAVHERVGVSVSVSHAWTRQPAPLLVAAPLGGARRSEMTGGASFDIKPNVAVFGSIGRTIGMAAEDGAGTTVGFGIAVSVAPRVTTRAT